MAIANGWKHFSVWNQILYLWSKYEFSSLQQIIQDYNIHTPRFLLVWPALKVSQNYNIDIDVIFSIFVLLSINLSIIISLWAAKNLSPDGKSTSLVFLAYPLIAIFMNGRICFAFLGVNALLASTILLDSYSRSDGLTILRFMVVSSLFGIGLWCTSVSTGSFCVILLAICMLAAQEVMFRSKNAKHFFINIFTFFFIIAVALYLGKNSIIKNLQYFEGDLSNMLSHGAGAHFTSSLPLTILSILVILMLMIPYLKIVKNKRPYRLVLPVVASALALGIFGYSTLITCLPGVLLLASTARINSH